MTLNIYATAVGTTLAMLNNLTRYDVFWLIFTLGGTFVMLGHSLFDQKVKHSAGKITYMIVVSVLSCLVVKFLYDEKKIELMSMMVFTLICSMIAPAITTVVLSELPKKVSEQILALPEWLFGLLKRKYDKNGNE